MPFSFLSILWQLLYTLIHNSHLILQFIHSNFRLFNCMVFFNAYILQLESVYLTNGSHGQYISQKPDIPSLSDIINSSVFIEDSEGVQATFNASPFC